MNKSELIRELRQYKIYTLDSMINKLKELHLYVKPSSTYISEFKPFNGFETAELAWNWVQYQPIFEKL